MNGPAASDLGGFLELFLGFVGSRDTTAMNEGDTANFLRDMMPAGTAGNFAGLVF